MKIKLQEGEKACSECGWFDTDSTFFTEVEGELYCSLHKEREGKDNG
jgi:hypothetical protein